MVRRVTVIAVLGIVFVVVHERRQHATEPAPAAIQSARVPEGLPSILDAAPDPAAVLGSPGALPGLDAIRRLIGVGDEAQTVEARPFADVGAARAVRAVRRDIRRNLRTLNRAGGSVPAAEQALAQTYSADVLTALGPRGRRAFAARVAGRTQVPERVRVLGFQGVFVAGSHALAEVVYRLSVRAPSGRFVSRSPGTWTVTLTREHQRWRFVRGLEGE